MGCVVLTVVASSAEEAARIAAALVDERLAACAQTSGPIHSRYHWKGKVETALEWRCEAKTTSQRQDEAMARVLELHSYDTPEVLVTPILTGNAAYLRWIEDEVKPR